MVDFVDGNVYVCIYRHFDKYRNDDKCRNDDKIHSVPVLKLAQTCAQPWYNFARLRTRYSNGANRLIVPFEHTGEILRVQKSSGRVFDHSMAYCFVDKTQRIIDFQLAAFD